MLLGPGALEMAGDDALDAALDAAEVTMSLKDAATAVAATLGLPRKLVYGRALERKARGSAP